MTGREIEIVYRQRNAHLLHGMLSQIIQERLSGIREEPEMIRGTDGAY